MKTGSPKGVAKAPNRQRPLLSGSSIQVQDHRSADARKKDTFYQAVKNADEGPFTRQTPLKDAYSQPSPKSGASSPQQGQTSKVVHYGASSVDKASASPKIPAPSLFSSTTKGPPQIQVASMLQASLEDAMKALKDHSSQITELTKTTDTLRKGLAAKGAENLALRKCLEAKQVVLGDQFENALVSVLTNGDSRSNAPASASSTPGPGAMAAQELKATAEQAVSSQAAPPTTPTKSSPPSSPGAPRLSTPRRRRRGGATPEEQEKSSPKGKASPKNAAKGQGEIQVGRLPPKSKSTSELHEKTDVIAEECKRRHSKDVSRGLTVLPGETRDRAHELREDKRDLLKMVEDLGNANPDQQDLLLCDIRFRIAKGQLSSTKWEGPDTPLRYAVVQQNRKLVRALIGAKANPNHRDEQGITPLHFAVYENETSMVETLVKAKATLNVKDIYGQTPLFFVSDVAMCDLLYGSRADMNCVNHKGQSALHLASLNGLDDVTKWMLDKVSHSVLHLKDKFGANALYNARAMGLKESITKKMEKDMVRTSQKPRNTALGSAPDRTEIVTGGEAEAEPPPSPLIHRIFADGKSTLLTPGSPGTPSTMRMSKKAFARKLQQEAINMIDVNREARNARVKAREEEMKRAKEALLAKPPSPKSTKSTRSADEEAAERHAVHRPDILSAIVRDQVAYRHRMEAHEQRETLETKKHDKLNATAKTFHSDLVHPCLHVIPKNTAWNTCKFRSQQQVVWNVANHSRDKLTKAKEISFKKRQSRAHLVMSPQWQREQRRRSQRERRELGDDDGDDDASVAMTDVEEEEINAAAIFIQKHLRGFVTRRRVVPVLRDVKMFLASIQGKDVAMRAVLKLQAVFRGHFSRLQSGSVRTKKSLKAPGDASNQRHPKALARKSRAIAPKREDDSMSTSSKVQFGGGETINIDDGEDYDEEDMQPNTPSVTLDEFGIAGLEVPDDEMGSMGLATIGFDDIPLPGQAAESPYTIKVHSADDAPPGKGDSNERNDAAITIQRSQRGRVGRKEAAAKKESTAKISDKDSAKESPADTETTGTTGQDVAPVDKPVAETETTGEVDQAESPEDKPVVETETAKKPDEAENPEDKPAVETETTKEPDEAENPDDKSDVEAENSKKPDEETVEGLANNNDDKDIAENKEAVDEVGMPEELGLSDEVGATTEEAEVKATEENGAPDEVGLPDEAEVKATEENGAPDEVGLPDDSEVQENLGPPEGSGPPDEVGLPDELGLPEELGMPEESKSNEVEQLDEVGMPEDVALPEEVGASEETGQPDELGLPDDVGLPDDIGLPDEASEQ